jgi:NAD(P)H-quinone oxidoreductase subunit 5
VTALGTVALLAVPSVPLIAAGAIVALRPADDVAARWAIRSSAVAATAAFVLVAAALQGPVEAVLTTGDGRAVMGLVGDRVTSVLALLTAGVALVVQSFARRALAGDPRTARFFAFASLLTSATAVVAISATGSGVALGWIVAGVSLAALVAHRGDWEPARRAHRRVRRSFALGDTALVLGLVIAGTVAGDLDLRAAPQAATTLAQADTALVGPLDLLTVVALLLVVAGLTRSAIIPFHRWLPATLAGPTPTSALLHAGVVNGAGVLLVRFAPIFGASAIATHVAFALGATTALLATAVMLIRADVKGNLVWSTAGQMGFMVVQCAVGAFSAALFHVLGHGMYKAALFLGSGNAISAHLEHRRHVHIGPTIGIALRRSLALVLPAAGLAFAYAIIDPDLDTTASILVVVFAWATGTRALRGWLDASPLRSGPTVLIGATVTGVASVGYLGGLAAFKGFVDPALPAAVPAAVGTAVLTGTLALIAIGLAGIRFASGDAADARRRRVYAQLLAFSAPVPSVARASRRARHAEPARVMTPPSAEEPDAGARPGVGHEQEVPG